MRPEKHSFGVKVVAAILAFAMILTFISVIVLIMAGI
jgi:hypothetical protein